MRRARVKEATIERELVARVRARGGVCAKLTGARGIPDRLVVLDGRVVLVECKRPRGGRLSAHQVWWRSACAAQGVAIVLVRSVADIDALIGA